MRFPREGAGYVARSEVSLIQWTRPGGGLDLRTRLRARRRRSARTWLRRAFAALLPHDRRPHGRRLHRGCKRPRGPWRHGHPQRHVGRLGRCGPSHHDGRREAVQGRRMREVPRAALLHVRTLHGVDDRARFLGEVRRRARRRHLLRHDRHLQQHARHPHEGRRGR